MRIPLLLFLCICSLSQTAPPSPDKYMVIISSIYSFMKGLDLELESANYSLCIAATDNFFNLFDEIIPDYKEKGISGIVLAVTKILGGMYEMEKECRLSLEELSTRLHGYMMQFRSEAYYKLLVHQIPGKFPAIVGHTTSWKAALRDGNWTSLCFQTGAVIKLVMDVDPGKEVALPKVSVTFHPTPLVPPAESRKWKEVGELITDIWNCSVTLVYYSNVIPRVNATAKCQTGIDNFNTGILGFLLEIGDGAHTALQIAEGILNLFTQLTGIYWDCSNLIQASEEEIALWIDEFQNHFTWDHIVLRSKLIMSKIVSGFFAAKLLDWVKLSEEIGELIEGIFAPKYHFDPVLPK